MRDGIDAVNAVRDALSDLGIRQVAPDTSVTRLASGLPVGADLEFTDDLPLKRAIEGRRDFSSFCENPEGQQSTIVVVLRSTVVEEGPEIRYRIEASHFLWKMVRRLVGTLVEVGRGSLSEAQVAQLLQEKSAAPAQWTAPPSGLFLERVKYPAGPPDESDSKV